MITGRRATDWAISGHSQSQTGSEGARDRRADDHGNTDRRAGDRRSADRRAPRRRLDPLFMATLVNHIAEPEALSPKVLNAYAQAARIGAMVTDIKA